MLIRRKARLLQTYLVGSDRKFLGTKKATLVRCCNPGLIRKSILERNLCLRYRRTGAVGDSAFKARPNSLCLARHRARNCYKK